VHLRERQRKSSQEHNGGNGPPYILKWVDALTSLLNLPPHNLGNQLGRQLLQRARRALPLNNLHHLLPNSPDLRRARIRRLLDLVRAALRKRNRKQPQQIVVGGLDDDIALDQSLPLADQRAQLVGREVQPVEVGEAVAALDLVDAEFHLAEGVVFVFLEVGEGNFEDAAFEGVVGVFETGGAVHEGFADTRGLGLCEWVWEDLMDGE